MKYNILCYTRKPLEDAVYAQKLADSMHIALVDVKGKVVILNNNYGVLFAKSVEGDNGVLCAKSLKNPWIFCLKNGEYGVIAERIEVDGSDDESSKGSILFYKTSDFISYTSENLVKLGNEYIAEATCSYDNDNDEYIVYWCTNDGKYYCSRINDFFNVKKSVAENINPFNINSDIPDIDISEIETAVLRNMIQIPDELANKVKCKLTVAVNTGIEYNHDINVSSREELDKIRVKAVYSDGTDSVKKVDWYAGDIDFTKPGTYNIEGRVHQDHYEFPIAFDRADPCVGRWNDKYYFIATNDADYNHTLYIREADSLPGLVTAQEVLILDSVTYPHIGNLLWAPEFHIINDRLYIFHAATPEQFGDEQSHVMALKEGGNPMKASDWEMPRRVVKKDGSPLFVPGITLDMTCFEVNGRYYVAWSQREFVPKDLGAWLYISEVDKNEPWRLIEDPVLLSKPEFGWANNHTFVDEGPFTLIKDEKVFMTFSSAAVDSTYVVGLLTADINSNLLVPSSWTKTNYPILTSLTVKGQYGTGHNAYIQDEEGLYWNTYHGRPGIDAPRSSGIRRVHFDIDGYPVLGMTEEKDLSPELTALTAKLTIK